MNPKVTRIMSIMLMVVALFGLASALSEGVSAAPGVPNQFYGSVNVNGAPAQDNIIIYAKIGSTVVANTLTRSGGYGYSPNIFYVEDPVGDREGQKIDFYTVTPKGTEIKAGSATFHNGASTRVDLFASGDFSQPSSTTTSGGTTGGSTGGGSFGGGGAAPSTASGNGNDTNSSTTNTNNVNNETNGSSGSTVCTPNWKCSDWTECVNGQQKRVCFDVNDCGIDSNKPAERQSCNQTGAQLLGQTNKGLFGISGFSVATAGSGLLAIILIAIIIGAFVLYRRSRR